MRKDKKLKITLMYIVLGIICLFSVYPFIWLIISSTLSDTDIFKLPPKLFFGNNFFKNFENLNINQPIWKAFKNSMFISVTYTILTLYLSSLEVYGFPDPHRGMVSEEDYGYLDPLSVRSSYSESSS